MNLELFRAEGPGLFQCPRRCGHDGGQCQQRLVGQDFKQGAILGFGQPAPQLQQCLQDGQAASAQAAGPFEMKKQGGVVLFRRPDLAQHVAFFPHPCQAVLCEKFFFEKGGQGQEVMNIPGGVVHHGLG